MILLRYLYAPLNLNFVALPAADTSDITTEEKQAEIPMIGSDIAGMYENEEQYAEPQKVLQQHPGSDKAIEQAASTEMDEPKAKE